MLIFPIVLGLIFFALAPRAAIFAASMLTGAFMGSLAWVIALIGGGSTLSVGSYVCWALTGALATTAFVHYG